MLVRDVVAAVAGPRGWMKDLRLPRFHPFRINIAITRLWTTSHVYREHHMHRFCVPDSGQGLTQSFAGT